MMLDCGVGFYVRIREPRVPSQARHQYCCKLTGLGHSEFPMSSGIPKIGSFVGLCGISHFVKKVFAFLAIFQNQWQQHIYIAGLS